MGGSEVGFGMACSFGTNPRFLLRDMEVFGNVSSLYFTRILREILEITKVLYNKRSQRFSFQLVQLFTFNLTETY